MSAADWELVGNTAGSWPKPTRDMVATDGQRLTLGDTTVTMYLTPGHTLGTISTIIPVRDGARMHTAAAWGGTAFNWTTNRAAYITPARPDRFWFETYIASNERFRDIVSPAPMCSLPTTRTSTAPRPRPPWRRAGRVISSVRHRHRERATISDGG